MKNRKNVYKPAKELGLNMISQNKQPVQFHLEKKNGISLHQKRDWFTAYIAQIKKGVNICQHVMSRMWGIQNASKLNIDIRLTN